MYSYTLLEDIPHSAYSPYTYRFILLILSIQTDSFCIFSAYVQISSSYLANLPNTKIRKGIIFLTAFKGTLLQNSIYVCNWTQDLQRIIKYFALGLKKNSAFYDNTQMTFKFENLGDFEFVFKNIFRYESGDQEGAFDERKQKLKVIANVPLSRSKDLQ
jgi:hypothetical protein